MIRTILAALLLAISTVAAAGWTPIVDPDTGDTATNPDYVTPQDPGTVEVWLEDLLGFDVTLVSVINEYDGSLLTGLSPGVMALHYGGPPTTFSTIGYICTVDCATFDPPDTLNGYGISNERYFSSLSIDPRCTGGTCSTVPEPGALALLGLGLVGLGFTRKQQ